MTLNALPATIMNYRGPRRFRLEAPPDSDEVVCTLYGVCATKGGWTGGDFDAADVRSAIEASAGKKLTIRLNSPGGDAFEGLAIYNLLKEREGETVCKVDGLAASAASIIMCGASKVVMGTGAQIMIHRAWSFAAGNAEALRETANQLEKSDVGIAAIYSSKCGKSSDEMLALMSAETWYTAEEAIEAKLADEKSDPGAPKEADPGAAEEPAEGEDKEEPAEGDDKEEPAAVALVAPVLPIAASAKTPRSAAVEAVLKLAKEERETAAQQAIATSKIDALISTNREAISSKIEVELRKLPYDSAAEIVEALSVEARDALIAKNKNRLSPKLEASLKNLCLADLRDVLASLDLQTVRQGPTEPTAPSIMADIAIDPDEAAMIKAAGITVEQYRAEQARQANLYKGSKK